MLLEFVGERRIFLDYVGYRVRAHERVLRRSYLFQEYEHVAAVCRKMLNRCRRCGKERCSEEDSRVLKDQVVCYHCGENHKVGVKPCERRKVESGRRQ